MRRADNDLSFLIKQQQQHPCGTDEINFRHTQRVGHSLQFVIICSVMRSVLGGGLRRRHAYNSFSKFIEYEGRRAHITRICLIRICSNMLSPCLSFSSFLFCLFCQLSTLRDDGYSRLSDDDVLLLDVPWINDIARRSWWCGLQHHSNWMYKQKKRPKQYWNSEFWFSVSQFRYVQCST